MRRLTWLAASFVLAACNPPAVDPNATFTIQGDLVDELGAPAANTTVYVFKTDSVFLRDDYYLQNLDDFPADAIYYTDSDSVGHFEMSLKGVQVNTAGGGGAAYLAAVYYKDGGYKQDVGQLATGTEWHHFADSDPVWEVGTLKLWDTGSASQIGSSIQMSWTAAPAGNEAAAGMPYFVFMYEAGDTYLRWADHTFNTDIDLPRNAFIGGNPAEFFIAGFSKAPGGSQLYQHRTGWGAVSNWGPGSGSGNWAYKAPIYDGAGMALSNGDYIVDNNIATGVSFPSGSVTALQLDLGGSTALEEIFVYNLQVQNLDDAVVTVSSTNEATASPPTSYPTTLATFVGSEEIQNWLYLDVVPASATSATWIRVQVDLVGVSGATPYFTGVDEIEVLGN